MITVSPRSDRCPSSFTSPAPTDLPFPALNTIHRRNYTPDLIPPIPEHGAEVGNHKDRHSHAADDSGDDPDVECIEVNSYRAT